MARSRNIKPGFFKNEDLGTADPFVSLLFAGLWTLADRDGILEDRPLRVKAELFPYRENFDINGYLTVLVSFGLIHRYKAKDINFIQIVNFGKHQNPHHTEKDSEYPTYSSILQEPVKEPLNNCDAPADSLLLIPNPLNTDSLITEPKKKMDQEYSDDFERAWSIYPKRSGANKKESYKAWNARLKAGALVGDMIIGTRAYAAYCKAMNTDPNYIKLPSTFFGPAEHYLTDWKITAVKLSTQDSLKRTGDLLTGRARQDDTITIDMD